MSYAAQAARVRGRFSLADPEHHASTALSLTKVLRAMRHAGTLCAHSQRENREWHNL
jgi:hypothetical protein